MECIKCGSPIDSSITRSQKYCSEKCKELYLKSQYRKRNRERLNAYKNEWRRAKNGGNRPIAQAAKRRGIQCLNCGSIEDLQLAHVKPIGLGGTHDHVITLCRGCHYDYDTRLKSFWEAGHNNKKRSC